MDCEGLPYLCSDMSAGGVHNTQGKSHTCFGAWHNSERDATVLGPFWGDYKKTRTDRPPFEIPKDCGGAPEAPG